LHTRSRSRMHLHLHKTVPKIVIVGSRPHEWVSWRQVFVMFRSRLSLCTQFIWHVPEVHNRWRTCTSNRVKQSPQPLLARPASGTGPGSAALLACTIRNGCKQALSRCCANVHAFQRQRTTIAHEHIVHRCEADNNERSSRTSNPPMRHAIV
jgi:hypothetical protein